MGRTCMMARVWRDDMSNQKPTVPYSLAEAIAQIEGYYADTSPLDLNRPQRNNNPGDIELSHFARLLPGYDPSIRGRR